VLARKWRPRSFEEMVGQEHVLRALVSALDNNRLHHAWLFTGTRGVGKTTLARILARCLNCEQGISSRPCGQCTSCREIDEGRCIDLIEVDAASRTRLEDTKELLDNVQYAPSRTRFKVYLIDEVHMLSTHSFNALLKTLEEPPPHVKFLLATTDAHKVPVTILSRCLQFCLKNMPPERIVGHLQQVLDAEKVTYEQSALWQLGQSADGSMRDALSLTDQAIAYCNGNLVADQVAALLGTVKQDSIHQLLDALMEGSAETMIAVVEEMAQYSPDYEAVLLGILSCLHRVAMAQALPDTIDNTQGDQHWIEELAKRARAEDIQLYYQSALIGRRDLPLAPDARAGFEMILLRMLAFRPAGAPRQPAASDTDPNGSAQLAPPNPDTNRTSTTGQPEKGDRPAAPGSAHANRTQQQVPASSLAAAHQTGHPAEKGNPVPPGPPSANTIHHQQVRNGGQAEETEHSRPPAVPAASIFHNQHPHNVGRPEDNKHPAPLTATEAAQKAAHHQPSPPAGPAGRYPTSPAALSAAGTHQTAAYQNSSQTRLSEETEQSIPSALPAAGSLSQAHISEERISAATTRVAHQSAHPENIDQARQPVGATHSTPAPAPTACGAHQETHNESAGRAGQLEAVGYPMPPVPSAAAAPPVCIAEQHVSVSNADAAHQAVHHQHASQARLSDKAGHPAAAIEAAHQAGQSWQAKDSVAPAANAAYPARDAQEQASTSAPAYHQAAQHQYRSQAALSDRTEHPVPTVEAVHQAGQSGQAGHSGAPATDAVYPAWAADEQASTSAPKASQQAVPHPHAVQAAYHPTAHQTGQFEDERHSLTSATNTAHPTWAEQEQALTSAPGASHQAVHQPDAHQTGQPEEARHSHALADHAVYPAWAAEEQMSTSAPGAAHQAAQHQHAPQVAQWETAGHSAAAINAVHHTNAHQAGQSGTVEHSGAPAAHASYPAWATQEQFTTAVPDASHQAAHYQHGSQAGLPEEAEHPQPPHAAASGGLSYQAQHLPDTHQAEQQEKAGHPAQPDTEGAAAVPQPLTVETRRQPPGSGATDRPLATNLEEDYPGCLQDLRPQHWLSVFQKLELVGIAATLAAHSELISVKGTTLLLRLDSEQDVLYDEVYRQEIEHALQQRLRCALTLAIETGAVATETPAAWRKRMQKERLEAARQSLRQDPCVQALVEQFSGCLLEESIEPVD